MAASTFTGLTSLGDVAVVALLLTVGDLAVPTLTAPIVRQGACRRGASGTKCRGQAATALYPLTGPEATVECWPEAAVKAGRVVKIVLLILVVLYLVLFHSANHVLVELPLLRLFFPPMPASYVVAFAIVVAYLVGFVPARLLAYQRGRQLKQLRKRLEELEPTTMAFHTNDAPFHHGEVPVIPDRGAHPRSDDPDDLEAG